MLTDKNGIAMWGCFNYATIRKDIVIFFHLNSFSWNTKKNFLHSSFLFDRIMIVKAIHLFSKHQEYYFYRLNVKITILKPKQIGIPTNILSRINYHLVCIHF